MVDFQLTTTQKQVKEFAHQFALNVMRPISLEADRAHTAPQRFLDNLAELGKMMSMGGVPEMPQELSGGIEAPREKPESGSGKKKTGQRNRMVQIGSEELAWGDASLLLCMPGPGLGGPPVQFTGTPEQRERFFGMLQKPGVHFGAYGLTEPGAGSDVSGIKTTCRKDGGDWVLNGRKCYITNGARADWVVIFATIDQKLGRAGHRAFVVEKGTPGFFVGKIEEKMGLRASETAELVLEDCRVPGENLLGGEAHYHGKEGFMTAMKTFDSSRPMVGIMAVGIARAAWETASAWVQREYKLARHTPRYAQLATLLAEDARLLDAARLMCWRAAWMADEGLPNAKEASMAKAYAARASTKICGDAVQILGAHGAEPQQLVEKWYRDIKVFDIFEGTGQIQRIVISKRILREAPSF